MLFYEILTLQHDPGRGSREGMESELFELWLTQKIQHVLFRHHQFRILADSYLIIFLHNILGKVNDFSRMSFFHILTGFKYVDAKTTVIIHLKYIPVYKCNILETGDFLPLHKSVVFKSPKMTQPTDNFFPTERKVYFNLTKE